MKFTEGNLFHIYNRGNNRQPIFFNADNYFYFLGKVRKYIYPYCDLLSYCLMPNHFNFLVRANSKTVSNNDKGRNYLSEGIKYLLSSYTKAVNIQESRTGSIFTQNTHSKKVDDGIYQAMICFLFIHQIPLKAGLVNLMEDWEYSSFRDYCSFRNGSLCNKELALKILNLNNDNFYSLSYSKIPVKNMLNIF